MSATCCRPVRIRHGTCLFRQPIWVSLSSMENVIDIQARSGGSGGGGRPPAQVAFDRLELATIMNVYGRYVAAGLWRDYAISMERDEASFSAFERTADRPDIRIVKKPALARKQGAYAIVGRQGDVLKRGADLKSLLSLLERKLMKVVEA
jgi:Protein of unknown function (DUF2794)